MAYQALNVATNSNSAFIHAVISPTPGANWRPLETPWETVGEICMSGYGIAIKISKPFVRDGVAFLYWFVLLEWWHIWIPPSSLSHTRLPPNPPPTPNFPRPNSQPSRHPSRRQGVSTVSSKALPPWVYLQPKDAKRWGDIAWYIFCQTHNGLYFTGSTVIHASNPDAKKSLIFLNVSNARYAHHEAPSAPYISIASVCVVGILFFGVIENAITGWATSDQ